MTKGSQSVRERILDAAVTLLRDYGLKKLAQPQVARAAGIPQGHLTYYFPRKVDLIAAVAERFAQMAVRDLQAFADAHPWADAGAEAQGTVITAVSNMVRDRARTRMLLGLIVESETDPALRTAMVRNAVFMRGILAQVMAREVGDPDVNLMLSALWGIGLHHLLLDEGGNHGAPSNPDAPDASDTPDAPDALVRRLTRLIETMQSLDLERSQPKSE